MTHKKVIFVIVEGPSDDEALGLLLSRCFNKNEVHIEITYGDITSRNGVTPDNIVSIIGSIVKDYSKIYSLKQSDFLSVIHIVDTDGAYISDDCVKESEGLNKTVYSLVDIKCSNRDDLIKRNEKKRANMDRIIYQPTVWKTIPYKVYFMASNLDHVLYDKQNNDDEGKKKDAFLFSRQYKDDIISFVNYMTNSDFAVVDGYKESWEFVKEDNHSLGRYSNFGLVFSKGDVQNGDGSCM